MNETKLVYSFLNSLIQKTTNNEIRWNYLDDEFNRDLIDNIGLIEYNPIDDSHYIFDFNVDSSFIFSHEDQNIHVLLVTDYEDNFPSLQIVPFTYRQIMTIDDSEYTATLTKLLNAVKRQFPNPHDFMESFIKN